MDDAQLAEPIKEIHDTSRRTYGSPRVHEELKAQGLQHGEKRVARIMQEEGLRAKAPRRFRVTTDSNHAHPIAPNVLDRQFAVEEGAALDRVWVGDISVPQQDYMKNLNFKRKEILGKSFVLVVFILSFFILQSGQIYAAYESLYQTDVARATLSGTVAGPTLNITGTVAGGDACLMSNFLFTCRQC